MIILLLVKLMLKIGPLPLVAALWHYRPDVIGTVAGLVVAALAVTAPVVIVAVQADRVYRAACVRRGRQLGVHVESRAAAGPFRRAP